MIVTDVIKNRWQYFQLLGVTLLVVAAVLAAHPGRAVASSNPPTSDVTLTPTAGTYQDAQSLAIQVAANPDFTSGAGIQIEECADPGGLVANLPTSDASCDGKTDNHDSLTVQPDGSVDEPAY